MRPVAFFLAFGLSIAIATPVRACSACQGDPNSDLVKGAKSGVVVMVVVTYALLMGFAGIIASWVVRGRRMAVVSARETAGELHPLSPRDSLELTPPSDDFRGE